MRICAFLATLVLGSVALAGCAAEGEDGALDSVGEANQAIITYGHLWDVIHEVNYQAEPTPINPVTGAPMTELEMVQAWELPVSIFDSGTTPSANSGYVCVTMVPNGNPICWNRRSFACASSVGACQPILIEASPEQGITSSFYIQKPLNSGNWKAWRGASGKNWQWAYRAKYGNSNN